MSQTARHESSAQGLLLVVDDDEVMRSALCAALSARGYRVVPRDSGETALAYLHEGERPDLIVLDLVMPRMDGWEFRLAQLSDASLARIPVLALSGDNSPKARALHADAFLAKPVSAPMLLGIVAQLLAKNRAHTNEDSEARTQLAQLGELIGESVRPLQLAHDLGMANLDAALNHLTSTEPDTARLLFWLSNARLAGRSIGDAITRAELFAQRNHAQAEQARARVLVVDDDPERRGLLALALSEFYRVNEAGNVADALRTLQAHDDYDVVVCRLGMRGCSGADLLFALRVTHPEQAARMLLLSGDSPAERLEERRLTHLKYLGVQRGQANLVALRSAIEASLAQQRH